MDNQHIIRKMANFFRAFSFVLLLTVLTACSSPNPQPVGTALLGIERFTDTPVPTSTHVQKETAEPTHAGPAEATDPTVPGANTPMPVYASPTSSPSSPTPRPTLGPDSWKSLPVVPTISDRVVEIYLRGFAAGNNPR